MNIQVGIIPTIGHKLPYIPVNHCVATLSDIPINNTRALCRLSHCSGQLQCNGSTDVLLTQSRIHKLSSIGHLGNRLPAYTYTQLRIHELSTNEHFNNTYTQTLYKIHKIRANGHLGNRLSA